MSSDLLRYAIKKAPKKTHFLYVEEDTMLSDVFCELPGNAIKIYTHLRVIAKGHIDGAIFLDISIGADTLAKRLHLSEETVRKMLMLLENRGFIDRIKQGGLKSASEGSNLYRLSKRFQKWGTDQFRQGKWKKITGWNCSQLEAARAAKRKKQDAATKPVAALH